MLLKRNIRKKYDVGQRFQLKILRQLRENGRYTLYLK